MENNKLKHRCIELIHKNRISSTEVADALGKKGVVAGVLPLSDTSFVVGEVYYIYAHSKSNWPIHEQIADMPEDRVVFVDSFGCDNTAIFGDLVAKYIMLYRQSRGVVVNGYLRDIPDLIKYNYPIWLRGRTPLGCFNRKVELPEDLTSIVKGRSNIFNGGIIVGDASGCTLIRPEEIDEELVARLEFIEIQEDVWSFCINTLKWSTYKTICEKDYLKRPEILPPELSKKIMLYHLD